MITVTTTYRGRTSRHTEEGASAVDAACTAAQVIIGYDPSTAALESVCDMAETHDAFTVEGVTYAITER